MKLELAAVERGWRGAWMRAIARLLPGERTATLPEATAAHPLRVLFLRYERIGDLIMATSLIRAIAESSPRVTLDVVASPAARPVLEHNLHVRKVFVLDRKRRGSYVKLGNALRRERYDVIVDGRINNPPVFTTTPLLMLRAGAPYRVGAGGACADRVYNVRIPAYDRTTHYIEASRLLAAPFGVDVDAVDWRPEIFLTRTERNSADAAWHSAVARSGADRERRLLVNLSASEAKRRWSDENFIAVLRDLRARRPMLPVMVIGLPREWERVRRVAASLGAEAVATPHLRQALALVATSDMVVTPDTSISHAASAFRKPAVVLLKRQHQPYGPWDIPGEIVTWEGETISTLPVARVREAVERLVAAVQRRS